MSDKTCEFEGCSQTQRAKKLCSGHYQQTARGEVLKPLGTKGRKPSAESKEAFFWSRVEKTDGCWNWTGSKTTLGYAILKYRGGVTGAYRFSYALAHGPIPENGVIDHLCHNPGCVNPAHLRAASHAQNMQNLRGAQVNSKSGFRGVYYYEKFGYWVAQVKANGKRVRKAGFKTAEEASVAAEEIRRELHS